MPYTYTEAKCIFCGNFKDFMGKDTGVPKYSVHTNNELYAQVMLEKHKQHKHPKIL